MDELDRILVSDKHLIASPGFTAATMRIVRREAARTSEIHFPWLRLAVGFIGGLICVLFSAAAVLEKELSYDSLHWMQDWTRPLLRGWGTDLGWTMVALIGSIIIVRLSAELTRQ